MNLFAEVMVFLAAAGLALFIGALLTEAMVLVPMWRTLEPQDFFTLHAAHAHRLYAFFAPLTVSATVLTVVAAVTSVAASRSLSSASVVAAVLALVILSVAVGTRIAPRPPAQIRTCGTTAYGSCLES